MDLSRIYEMQQKLHIQTIRNQQHKEEASEDTSIPSSKKVKMIGKCAMINY